MTIKEAQELVDAWNAKNAACGSALTSAAFINERAGKLADAIAREKNETRCNHHEALNPILSEEISGLFWELLSLCNKSGIDLTEALASNLDKKNG